ncbi:MAG: hypothetical protein HFG75_08145 [Hungatella sp.]|nr:hypothetical protein [Hungatella sp.]
MNGDKMYKIYRADKKLKQGGGEDIDYPAALSVIVPYPEPCGGLFPLFLPQDMVNALADLLGFFHFLLQCILSLRRAGPKNLWGAGTAAPVDSAQGTETSNLPMGRISEYVLDRGFFFHYTGCR